MIEFQKKLKPFEFHAGGSVAAVLNKRCVNLKSNVGKRVGVIGSGREGKQQRLEQHRCCIRDKENIGSLSTPEVDNAVDINRKRRKPGKLFFITVGFHRSVWSDTHEQLLYNLRFDWAVEIVSYAVGLERSDKSENIDYHLHAFIEYAQPVFIDDIRSYLSVIYDS